MRHLLAFVLMIALVGFAAAADLGNTPKDTKDNYHVGMNPGTPDGREGGEDIGTAVVIPGLPFSDTGNTSDNIDDYDVACPYGGSTSADVVYAYTPAVDEIISVDLCGSGYDTKTFIYGPGMAVVGCNDDFYFDDVCGVYVSFIEEAFLTGGTTYHIVIDGYGGDAGDYILNIEAFTPPPPCIIDCPDDEGEPELVDGYMDSWNGGCNSPEFGNPFSILPVANEFEMLTYCGQSGWYLNDGGGNSRDTDWFIGMIGATGVLEWTLDAEQETLGFLLEPQDCGAVAVADQITVGPCAPATMIIQGAPGSIVWLWVGPSVFAAPGGFVGNEYMWVSDFVGLEGTVATESITFDGVKSLYR